MDILLGKVTQQAMNYAIRSGITITGTYAIRECSRLLKSTPKDSTERDELVTLQIKLESKIRIISPAIDMIELIAARGNTSLESAVSLTKELRWEIQALGIRLNNAANDEELFRRKSTRAKSREQTELELKRIIGEIKKLLSRIENAVPLISLAITTSGVNLSTNLPATISPSRLLQASTFLTAADSAYALNPKLIAQVGPIYVLSMYMLFAGHTGRLADEEGVREMTWKEVIHKARVKLMRVPLDDLYGLPGANGHAQADAHSIRAEGGAAEYAYQLVFVEDLDDHRVHTFEDGELQPGPFDDVTSAGIRDLVPIHEVSKIFYADTGKILNIGGDSESNNPVLLLKRDVHAEPPRRMMDRQRTNEPSYFDDHVNGEREEEEEADEQSELDAQILRESTPNTPAAEQLPRPLQSTEHWRLPPGLDPEWIAFEVYTEDPDDESDFELPSSEAEPTSNGSKPPTSRQASLDPSLTGALNKLNIRSSAPLSSPDANGTQIDQSPSTALAISPKKEAGPPIKTSLSLLEMLIRLTALQQFRQESHLAIEDELLNFFLEDSATTGAGSNAEYRQRIRRDARRRVGFDPYDESPIKRRGEEYIAHPRARSSPVPDYDPDAGYGYESDDPGWQSTEQPLPSIENPPYLPHPPSSPASPSLRMLPARSISARSSPSLGTPSISHRAAVQAKYARPTSQASNLATPPSTAKGRQAVLRSQNERKLPSPLGREVFPGGGRRSDEGIGMSISSADLESAKQTPC